MREQITFDFSGSYSGAYRDIPVRAGESITDVSVSEGATAYRPGANTELGGFGLPDSFGVTDIDGGLRIVWHYAATDERRTFTISYRFRGLAVAYDDVVDVNLRVWGEHWPVGVANLTAVMQLPRPTKLSPSYRVWGNPAWVRAVVGRAPDRATLQAVQVPTHQFVEHRVLFPRNLLTSTAGAQVRPGNALGKIVAAELAAQRDYERDQEKIDDAKEHPGRTLLLLLLLGLGPALGLMGLVWLFYGRELRTGYDREYEQAPPTDTEPALIPSLVKQETVPGSNEFTATLFDLIRRGRYKATPVTTERSVWGGLRHQDVADLLVTPGDETIETAPFEGPVTRVVDSVVDSAGQRLSEFREEIEGDREANSKRFKSFKEQVETAIKERTWFVSKGLVVIGAGFGAVRARGRGAPVDGHRRLARGLAPLERRRPRHAGRLRRGQRRRAPGRRVAVAAVAPPDEGRADRGRALGGVPPLPDRLPATPGGAAGNARAVGALPRLRDRIRDRRARPAGSAPAHARGAERAELDLLDQPDRRPRLGPDRTRDRRPLVGVRLRTRATRLQRRRRRLLRRGRRRRWRRRRRRLVARRHTDPGSGPLL